MLCSIIRNLKLYFQKKLNKLNSYILSYRDLVKNYQINSIY